MDHRDNDCIVVTVLSHGKKGRLEASDGPYDIDEILEPILNSQSLIGKPKLFFIQASNFEFIYKKHYLPCFG